MFSIALKNKFNMVLLNICLVLMSMSALLQKIDSAPDRPSTSSASFSLDEQTNPLYYYYYIEGNHHFEYSNK